MSNKIGESELNPRQKKVIRKIVDENKTASTSYQEVYGTSENVSRANASRLLANANIKNALERELRVLGISEESVALAILKLSKNSDWKAISKYIELAAKYLGCDNERNTLDGDQLTWRKVDR